MRHDRIVTLCLLVVFACTCIVTPSLIGYGVYLGLMSIRGSLWIWDLIDGVGISVIMFFFMLAILVTATEGN